MTKILLVGENQVDLRFLMLILQKSQYEVLSESYDNITDEYVNDNNPDVIVIDVEEEDSRGIDLCKHIHSSEKLRDKIIFLLCDTSDGDIATAGFEAGATDCLSKPVNEDEVKTRISSSIFALETVKKARSKNSDLTSKVDKIMSKVIHQKTDVVFTLAKMVQSRDDITGFNLERTQKYIYILADELRKNPKYSNVITEEFIENLVPASALHDIGKVGIPDKILLKPGKLTTEEFETVKTHTQIGYETIENVENTFGKSDFLECAKKMAKYHHERPDGTGYPEKLKDKEIPLEASIMALVDVYDALRMKKVYKPSISHENTIKIITEGKGTQFQSDVTDAFLKVEKEFAYVWLEYSTIS